MTLDLYCEGWVEICQVENERKHILSICAIWREGYKCEIINGWRTENNVFEYWGALEKVAEDTAGKVVCVYSGKFMVIVYVETFYIFININCFFYIFLDLWKSPVFNMLKSNDSLFSLDNLFFEKPDEAEK